MNDRRALFDGLEDVAGTLEAFGAVEAAGAVRATVARARAELAAWWDEPLTVAAAAAWGGYSEAGLRRLMREGKVPSTAGGIRRRHVPIQPGHEPPLGLEPVELAAHDWVADLRRKRPNTRAAS